MTPVFGQGANSALESCKVLDDVLTAASGDLDSVPEAFTRARTADAHALYEIDRKAYSFFRRKGPLDPDFLQLMSHVVVGTILSKIVPFFYGPKPALLKLGSLTPYSEILSAIRRDSTLLLVMVLAPIAFFASKYLDVFRSAAVAALKSFKLV